MPSADEDADTDDKDKHIDVRTPAAFHGANAKKADKSGIETAPRTPLVQCTKSGQYMPVFARAYLMVGNIDYHKLDLDALYKEYSGIVSSPGTKLEVRVVPNASQLLNV